MKKKATATDLAKLKSATNEIVGAFVDHFRQNKKEVLDLLAQDDTKDYVKALVEIVKVNPDLREKLRDDLFMPQNITFSWNSQVRTVYVDAGGNRWEETPDGKRVPVIEPPELKPIVNHYKTEKH